MTLRSVSRAMIRRRVPTGNPEIIRRAVIRARLALETKDTDLGVGFSEGVIELDGSIFTAAWCAVVTRDGVCHLGGGLHMHLPDHLLRKVEAGSLLEGDIEAYLQKVVDKPFERLVEYATVCLAKGGSSS